MDTSHALVVLCMVLQLQVLKIQDYMRLIPNVLYMVL